MTKIIPVISEDQIKNSEDTATQFSKDWAIARSMMAYARKTPQSNLTPLKLNYVTRKTKLVLVLCPMWATLFAPYNLAKLSAITKAAGYHTKVYDINVKVKHALNGKTEVDLWDTSKDWMWKSNRFLTEALPLAETVLLEYVQKIVDDNPDVVGFSMYNTNETATNWFTLKLKKLLPNTKFILGGPQTLTPTSSIISQLYHHIVKGEGEQLILDLLNKIEQDNNTDVKYLTAERNRLDLDSFPIPDYSHFDLNEYMIPNGLSSELTRGCVAKCTFCTETHYWKYRGRMAKDVIQEIKAHYEKYGPITIWFIDSLINGNLNELRAFALGLIEENISITYVGNVRIDSRMDFAYLKDLAKSGCKQVHAGIESGSQQVLTDMKKMITVDDIEKNLRDMHSLGIDILSNWMIGFPSEDAQAFADTLTLFCRVAKYHNGPTSAIQVGTTFHPLKGSEVGDNPELFDIDKDMFENSWTTTGLTNTKLHRLIRQKSWVILVQQLHKKYNFVINTADLTPTYNSYNIKYNEELFNDNIPFITFDYNIINSELGQFANTAMNQIWPLLHTLWRSHGAYKINLKFDPKFDLRAFGDRLSCDYRADHKFFIDKNGQWTADFTYQFKTVHGMWKDMGDDNSFNYSWQGRGSW